MDIGRVAIPLKGIQTYVAVIALVLYGSLITFAYIGFEVIQRLENIATLMEGR